MTHCAKIPCGSHSGGCTDPYCPMSGNKPVVPSFPGPFLMPAQVMGCICPPTSEKTCENPMCARQNPFKRAGFGHVSQSPT